MTTDLNGDPGTDTTVLAVLEGGPSDLPPTARTGRVAAGEEKIKVAHRGGYEHFERTAAPAAAASAASVVYRWTTRTKMAE